MIYHDKDNSFEIKKTMEQDQQIKNDNLITIEENQQIKTINSKTIEDLLMDELREWIDDASFTIDENTTEIEFVIPNFFKSHYLLNFMKLFKV